MVGDFELLAAGRRVLEGALGIVPGEHVVIATDRARLEIATLLVDLTQVVGARPWLFVLEDLEPRPIRALPAELREALGRAQASVLLASLDESELSFRKELVALVRVRSLRHAHMIGVTRRSMIAGLSVDPARILNATRVLRSRLRADSVFHLRTPAGSDLTVKIDPSSRWFEQVGVIRPGRWENVPSGELFTSPADVRGVFVADASVGASFGFAAGLLTPRPIRVEIEGGHCRQVRCVDRGLEREVEAFMRRDPNGDRVGIVVLGTNVGRVDPLGDAIADQTMPGLHVSFGATYPEETGARWTARTQLPMTCAAADVDLDGVAILRAGRYLLG